MLYYDGRKALVHALRTLIQGRSGVSWTLGASDDITDLISKYTQSLIEDGLVDKILSKYMHSLTYIFECVQILSRKFE